MKKFSILLVILILLGICSCDIKEADVQSPDKPPVESIDHNFNRSVQLKIVKDGIEYMRYTNNAASMTSRKLVCVYENVDKSQLESTGEVVTVEYMGYTPVDDVKTFATTTATLYELSDEIKNDPYIHVIAAKLETKNEIMIFAAKRKPCDGEPLNAFFHKQNRSIGTKCVNPEDIEDIKIIRLNEQVRETANIQSEKRKEFFERVGKFKYTSQELSPSTGTAEYNLIFNLKDGTMMPVFFYPESSAVRADGQLYIADENFEDYLKSFFKK